MFLLDTNVLSAMMSRAGAPEVLAWLAGQPADLLFTASVCQAEILAGVAIMPAGRRRQDVEGAALALFREANGKGWGRLDDSAVVKVYAERAGIELPAPKDRE